MAIEYANKPFDWDNEGIIPPQDLTEKGFQPGYKPPAEYFNAILYNIFATIKEIQGKTVEFASSVGRNDKSAGKKVEGELFSIDNVNVTAAEGAEIFNYYDINSSNKKQNKATGKYSTAMGYNSLATGDYAVAMGCDAQATGFGAFAMGSSPKATERYAIAMGAGVNATAEASVAMGRYAEANGKYSIAKGYNVIARGEGSAVIGVFATANGDYSVAIGYEVTANKFNFVFGKYNKAPTPADINSTLGDIFVIGNGTSSTKSNAFRVTAAGAVMGTQNYTASGADYAEMFEWADGNPNNEDRRGLFVTLDGEKIRPASADDDYILGVVSAAPSVVADAQTDDWGKKWKTDVFGERLLDENGAWILNEDFREEENESYVSRLDRKEWAAVGLVGKLIVVDDGTCEVNGYCSPSNGGIATKSKSRYRVLSRVDENHIKVLIK